MNTLLAGAWALEVPVQGGRDSEAGASFRYMREITRGWGGDEELSPEAGGVWGGGSPGA